MAGGPVDRKTVAGKAGSQRGLVGDSAQIAVAVGVSRLSGLFRIMLAAAVLGSTVLGDLFVAVNVLPLTLYDVVAGSAISSVLVPPLVRFIDRGQMDRARRLAGNALGLIFLVMAAVSALAVLGRGWVAAALTSGVSDLLANEAARIGGLLVLLIAPQLVAYAAIGVFVSIQHAHRRFLLPSAAPIVENIGLIITIGIAWAIYGGGREVTDTPIGLILVLGLGSGLSVLAHVLVQYVGARRAAGGVGFGTDWRDPSIRRLAGPTRDSFGWSTVIALRHFALIVAAGFAGAGGIQAFEIATLAYIIPVALVGRPIASAALPRLARRAAGSKALLSGYLAALRLAAWVAVPAGLALILLSRPLAAALAQGQFDGPDSSKMLAFGLAGLGLGAASDALFEVARQATMARGETAGLRRSSVIRALAAIIGIPLVVVTLDGASVLLALGLVVSFGDLTAFVVTHRALRSDPAWPIDSNRYWPRIVVASLLGLVPVALLAPASAPMGDTATLGVVAAAAVILYSAVAFVVTDRGRMISSLGATFAREELA